MDQKKKTVVSVVIPALNEQNAIAQVIGDLPINDIHEVIVVDNGSTDDTPRVAEQCGARVFHEPKRGYGSAVLRGLKNISIQSNVVVILDADYSDYPEDIHKLLDPIRRGEADMVLGNRTQLAQAKSLTAPQRFGNWLTTKLIYGMYKFKFSDMGPFRAIDRTSLENLKMQDPHYGWNVEMQLKALNNGLKIKEVPVQYRPRIGKSKISGTIKGVIHAGVVILWSVFKYGRSRKTD